MVCIRYLLSTWTSLDHMSGIYRLQAVYTLQLGNFYLVSKTYFFLRRNNIMKLLAFIQYRYYRLQYHAVVGQNATICM